MIYELVLTFEILITNLTTILCNSHQFFIPLFLFTLLSILFVVILIYLLKSFFLQLLPN